MGRLFPELNPDEIENSGERAVARALVEQLPNRIEIFHSFNWLGRNRHGTLMEGECDFVLLDRNSGLLFVDVKGGSLVFDGSDWTRKDGRAFRLLNKDPFAQARQSMHEIVSLVTRRFRTSVDKLPFTYGVAVAFPDSRVAGTLPPSIQPELVLDAARLQSARDSIQRVFGSFRRPHHRALHDREIESVREALYPKYELVPVVWRKIEEQEERLRRLTDEQRRLLDFLSHQPRAAICGVAGSGKTMLALAKAQRAARAGQRTLLLCYNRPLQDWLKASIPKSFGDNLVVLNYHSLAHRLCREADVPLLEGRDLKDPEVWNVIAPEALIEACDLLGPEHKFDAVVVDEGQDFRELWWMSLEAVFRNPGSETCYYVFYDPKQNLYVDEPCLPEGFGPPFPLTVNCRNTIRIAAHCASLAGYENEVRGGAPLGDEPEIMRVRTLADALREAGKRIREYCMPGRGGLKQSQVAVLAPTSTNGKWPASFGAVPLTTDLHEWRRGEGALIASWRRFKGLEADAVVIIETPTKNGSRNAANRYVARSRAKHLLTIIETQES